MTESFGASDEPTDSAADGSGRRRLCALFTEQWTGRRGRWVRETPGRRCFGYLPICVWTPTPRC